LIESDVAALTDSVLNFYRLAISNLSSNSILRQRTRRSSLI